MGDMGKANSGIHRGSLDSLSHNYSIILKKIIKVSRDE